MKKWIFLALMMVLGACTADYDTFDTSDYRELKDISVAEQDGSPAIYSEQHRIEFDLVKVPDSLDTWESVSLDVLSMSHFATLHLVEDKIKEFLTNPADDPNLPEKEIKQIEGYGACPVTKGIISLQNDRGTSYRAYIAVQNELIKAINELRDEFSTQNYGKKFGNLTQEQQKIVKEAVPQSISEAEPKDTGKK